METTEKRVPVRIPKDLYDRLVALATEENRSLNGQILSLIKDRVEGVAK